MDQETLTEFTHHNSIRKTSNINMIITGEVSRQDCGDCAWGILVGAAKVLTVIRHCQASFLLVPTRTKTYIVKSGYAHPKLLLLIIITQCQLHYKAVMMYNDGSRRSSCRSHMNCLKPFKRTITQITETMLASPKIIAAASIWRQIELQGYERWYTSENGGKYMKEFKYCQI